MKLFKRFKKKSQGHHTQDRHQEREQDTDYQAYQLEANPDSGDESGQLSYGDQSWSESQEYKTKHSYDQSYMNDTDIYDSGQMHELSGHEDQLYSDWDEATSYQEDGDYLHDDGPSKATPGNYRLDKYAGSDSAEVGGLQEEDSLGQRSKYSYKIDKFLNNGIILLGILLIVVLLIAFIV